MTKTSSIATSWPAYWTVDTANKPAYAADLEAIQRHLTKTHGFPIGKDDLDGLRTRTAPSIGTARDELLGELDLSPLSGGNAATYGT